MIKNGEQISGISLEIWRRVAEDNNLSYELITQPTPKAGIEAVDEGVIDVLVGRIRRKLNEGDGEQLIRTVRGVGYSFCDHAA